MTSMAHEAYRCWEYITPRSLHMQLTTLHIFQLFWSSALFYFWINQIRTYSFIIIIFSYVILILFADFVLLIIKPIVLIVLSWLRPICLICYRVIWLFYDCPYTRHQPSVKIAGKALKLRQDLLKVLGAK